MINEETAGARLARLGVDAMRWAEDFRKQYPDVPLDSALTWFACAIESGRSAGWYSVPDRLPPAAETFLRWLVRMEDPNDGEGQRDRQTVTLSKIIDSAAMVLNAYAPEVSQRG